jgi:hypothetical protein
LFYFSTSSCGKAGLAPAFFALRALRAHLRAPHRSACLSELEVLLSCAPFNAPLCSATATGQKFASRRCACALHAFCPLCRLSLSRSARAHICLALHIPHAPRRRVSRRSRLYFSVFCIIFSLRMWKRGFSTICAPKLQGLRRAPVAHRLRYKT